MSNVLTAGETTTLSGRVHQPRPMPSKPRPADPLDYHVLLVEDNEDHQPLLSQILRRAGVRVTIAENGQQAIDLATARREPGSAFDLILMDLQMPVVDGLTAVRRLRAAGFVHPIVALTARAVSSDRDNCLKAGFNDFLRKPINGEELIARLVAHLGSVPELP